MRSSSSALVRANSRAGAFARAALVPSRLWQRRVGVGPPPRKPSWSNAEAVAFVSTCTSSRVVFGSISSSSTCSTRCFGRECGEGGDFNSASASGDVDIRVGDASALAERGNDDASEGRKGGGGTELESRRPQIYLHVAPDGDYWTGTSIFAAKHLQPDYVKSMPLPDGFLVVDGEGDEERDHDDRLDELFGGNEDVIRWIYDEGRLPPSLLGRMRDDEGHES